MPGPYDWAQAKQAMAVPQGGATRGTMDYARRPPAMAAGMSRFHPTAAMPQVGGGMEGPPRTPLNMPPPGVVQGNRQMIDQARAADPARAMRMQQAAAAANTPERMAARQAAMAAQAGSSAPAPTPPAGMPAGAQRVGGPGMAGLAKQLGPGQSPPPSAQRLATAFQQRQQPPV